MILALAPWWSVIFGIALWSQVFWQTRSNSGSCAHQWKVDDAKWNRSISEAKCNECWKSVLPPTLDPESSTAYKETFKHFEMIVSCSRRALLQFLWSDELNIYRPTVASVALEFTFFLLWKKCSLCANDVNFNLFTQTFMVFNGASMHCVTHL